MSDYIIEKKLGEGVYGVVYKIKKKDNENYVLKQISLLGLSEAQKKDFKKEAEILSKINSKYVVKNFESFEENNKFNIIMEYCENGDLSEYIEKQKKKGKPLEEKEIWSIFIKITIGLADIHKINILHRDLKTLNVFLKKDNDIRVGDLGVAKVLDQTFFAKTYIGTPYYLSPEICEDKPYNDKSDVWALGNILYELCTYNHPFTGNSQPALIQNILNKEPKPIQNNYSNELKQLVSKILNKNYRKRPSCLDILKMPFIINKAKELGIFDDIKKSFPEIIANNKPFDKKNQKPLVKKELKIKQKNSGPANTNSNNNNKNNNNNRNAKANVKPNDFRQNRSANNNIKKNNNKKGEKIELVPCTERRRKQNLTKSENTKISSNNNNIINSNDNLKDTINQIMNDNIDILNNDKKEDNKEDNSNKINDDTNNERFILMMNNEKDNNNDTLNGLIYDFGNEENEEEEKINMKKELDQLKERIDYLKEDIPKLIGEEKFKNILEIYSVGIKDESKQAEVNEKIENFIKENKFENKSDDEKLYNIFSLFILECQYYKKEKELNNMK